MGVTLLKYLAPGLVLVLVLVAMPAAAQTKPPAQAQAECVQQQFNVLGYRSGTITGVIDSATVEVAERYAADMRARSPGWGMAALTPATALEWCQRTAEANPSVLSIWHDYRRAYGSPESPAAAGPEPTTLPSSPAAAMAPSPWESRRFDDGRCVTVASPHRRDPGIAGDGRPQIFLLRAPGGDPNRFFVDLAGRVPASQIHIEVAGVIYPTIYVSGDSARAVLLSRSVGADGKPAINVEPGYGIANRAIAHAMRLAEKLVVRVVVRDGPDIGKVYEDEYALGGFATALAASEKACP